MIVKMQFVSITGPTDDIDRVINTYLSKYEIHLENAMLEHSNDSQLIPYVDSNPYRVMYEKASELVKYTKKEPISSPNKYNIDASNNIISRILSKVSKLNSQLEGLNEKKKLYQEQYDKIFPFYDLEYDMASILNLKHIKFRFGRMPKESWKRLETFKVNESSSIFFKCATDDEYVWGIYFVPRAEKDKIDALYTSLHFEKTFIPRESVGTPKETCEELQNKINTLNEKIELIQSKIDECIANDNENIIIAYERIKAAYDNFDVRKMAAKTQNKDTEFYIICGWMSKKDAISFTKEVENDELVMCFVEEKPENSKKTPPTKLKNPKIFKPFEMFIRMYGLPAYNEIDPTILVALTYSFIFGAMFGDVGQGFLLFLGGLILYLVKKINLAAIISCAGFFSMFWGFMFGSIFGFEDIIDAVWLHPMTHMTTIPFVGKLNTVFIVAIAFGMGIIIFTMILHIINGIKHKDVENIFFDTNAIAGLVFFGAVVATIVLFMTGNKLPGAIVLIIMFIIPLLIIAAKEPLTRLVKRKSSLIEGGIGMFIVQAIFELIEVLLSYFSNTLSFVRIGAFAVSHAAIMEVVLMLAGAENGSPSIPVIVIGNLFVMLLEGLIVGIQVLRLEYYEMFSRFYKGTGREFKPYKQK
ncbi:MAG: ATPase [Lachnospiraceae bacterium]|nr:ATPase [Lachnospiraceae bacterium]